MKVSAIKLPRRRFFKLRGNIVELAVGLLVLSLLEAEKAQAEEAHGAPEGSIPPVISATPLDGKLAAVSADQIKTMSVDELKALLDAKALAALGLDEGFLKLLDTDAAAAIRKLETAFREKIKAVAKGEAKIAAAGDAHHDGEDVRHAEDVHHESGFAGISPLLLLGGLAVIGGGIALAASGGDDDDDAPSNRAPAATADTVSTNEDTAVTFDVRANDTDSDGDSLSVTQINGTAITTTSPVAITGGTISLGTDGRLTFTPSANFNGTPTFTYTLSDGHGGTSTATVTLNVAAVNDAPVAVADSFTTAEDTATVINVRGNDTDVDGDTLTVTQVNGQAISTTVAVAVTGGSVILNAAGNIVFTPNANYNGAPTFTYTVSDGKGGTATATVTGTVTAVNDAPVNGVPTTPISATAGAAVGVPGISVSDVDSATLTTTVTVGQGLLSLGSVTGGAVVSGLGTGTLTLTGTAAQINASLSALTFTGRPGFAGTDTLTIVTSDGSLTDTDTLTLNIGRLLSGIVQDGYISGARVFFDANGNGTFDEGELTAVTDANGRYTLTTTGTPVGNIVAFGGVNIDTGLPNRAVLMAPAGSGVVNPLTTLVAQLTATGMSVEAATAQVAAALGLPAGLDITHLDFLAPTTDPALSLAMQKAAVQIVTIINDAIAAGSSSAAVTAALGKLVAAGGALDLTSVDSLKSILMDAGLSADAANAAAAHSAAINQAVAAATTIGEIVETVHDLNQAGADLPVATVGDAVTTDEDKPVTFDVRLNDIDPEGGPLTVTKINGVSISPRTPVLVTGGVVSIGEDGRLTFTPNADFHGAPSFQYTVTDAAGHESVGTVDLTVNAVNDAPVAGNDTGVVGIGVPVSIDVLGNDRDVDGDTLSVVAVNGTPISGNTAVAVTGGSVTLGADGHLVFTPNPGYVGSPQFDYTVSDGHGGTSTGSVDLSLQAPVVDIAATELGAAADHAAELAAAGVTTLDIVGDTGTLSDSQAAALVAAGIDFADADNVTLNAEGTHLNTTLKGLQSLHVDSISVRAGVQTLSIAAGGTLASLSSDHMPQFDIAQSDAALDVTLTVDGGAIDPSINLGSLASALGAAGIDHIGVAGNGALALNVAQGQALLANGIDFAPAADITLGVSAAEAVQLATTPALLTALHVDHLDVTGDAVTITDAQATTLIVAGVDFVEGDNVTLNAEGTHLNVTLKGLQSLHVDSISVRAGVQTLALNAGGALASISASDLPQFDIAQSDAALDVTLTVDAGTIDPGFNLGSLASALGAAGIDHIGVAGNGALALNVAQGQALLAGGVDFVEAADITLGVTGAEALQLAANPTLIAALHVDHLDVAGDTLTITDAQAANLIATGVDFVEGDNVTVSAEGTHLNTTLKGLQSLHIDSIAVRAGVHVLALDAGGALSSLSASDLPHFDIAQSDASLDVTVNVAAGDLDTNFDLGSLASALSAHGVDHIGVVGNGELGITLNQAEGMAAAGLDFRTEAEIALHISATELVGLANDPSSIAGVHVDTIDVTGNFAQITDVQAHNLVEAGLHFADADTVTVEASGTHMSTSLRSLHDLKVDSIAVAAGVTSLHVDAGDLDGLSASDLPQFDIAQSDAALDVTLRVDAGELSQLDRLAKALADAGVDHIAINKPLGDLDAATAADLAAITKATGIDFSYEDFAAPGTVGGVVITSVPAEASHAALYQDLLSTFEASEDHGHGGSVELADGAASSLAESGMLRAYTADVLVVDGTASGDKLLTTLKDVADLGVDQVKLADQHGSPVYVDIGIQADAGAVDEIKTLFKTLELGSDVPEKVFTGAEKVALVVDADTAQALSHVDGAIEHLASLGFTEIDVLASPTVTAPPAFGDTTLEVKLIGAEDDIYKHFHHER